MYLELSADICRLNLVWKCCLEVSVGATPGGKGLRIYCEPLRSRGSSASFPGRERAVPGRAPLHAPRSPSRASAAILSPGTARADVWGGRGTVVVPRGVRWRSGLAAVFWVFYNRYIFKDPFGHHDHHHHHHYRGALYNKDYTAAKH